MKATIGLCVQGDCAAGNIIAMTKQWCIYMDDAGNEFAEPWDQIVITLDAPDCAVTAITQKEADHEG